MNKVKLGTVLKEEKTKIGNPDGNGLDLIGVSNDFGLHTSRAQRIDDLSRYQLIKIGWFAYNPMRINVGSIGIAESKEHEGIVSPDYVVFSCTEKILPEYLFYFLKSDLGLEAINRNASGTVRKRLYYSDLARIEIYLPEIDKQIEILESLNKIEKIVSQLQNPLRKKGIDQLKQSILQEAIQGKLTEDWRMQHPETEPASELLKRIKAEKNKLIKDGEIKKEKPLPPITENEIPFELPVGWVWCRLGEIISSSDNLNIHNELEATDLINYVDIDAIDNKKQVIREPKLLPVHQLSSRARRVLKKGNIMYSLVRPYLHNLAIVEDNCHNYIGSTGFAVFDCLIIENKFVFWLLLTKYIEDIYMGFMDGFNSPSITHDQFRSTIIPFPPLEEQKTIVQKVETLMEKCRALEAEITQSEQHAQMLMQAVLKEAFKPKKGLTLAAKTNYKIEEEIKVAAEPGGE